MAGGSGRDPFIVQKNHKKTGNKKTHNKLSRLLEFGSTHEGSNGVKRYDNLGVRRQQSERFTFDDHPATTKGEAQTCRCLYSEESLSVHHEYFARP